MKKFLTGKSQNRLVFFLVSCVLFLGALPSVALADEQANSSGFFMGIKGGTLGVGLDFGKSFGTPFDDSIEVKARLNANLGRSRKLDLDDEKKAGYLISAGKADVNFLNVGVLGDVHPLGNGFRVTAGLYLNAFRVNTKEEYASGFFIVDEEAKYTCWAISPYAGIGWGTDNSRGLSFNLDLGYMYVGNVSVSYPKGSSKSRAAIDARTKSVQDACKKYAPVAMVGLSYQF